MDLLKYEMELKYDVWEVKYSFVKIFVDYKSSL